MSLKNIRKEFSEQYNDGIDYRDLENFFENNNLKEEEFSKYISYIIGKSISLIGELKKSLKLGITKEDVGKFYEILEYFAELKFFITILNNFINDIRHKIIEEEMRMAYQRSKLYNELKLNNKYISKEEAEKFILGNEVFLNIKKRIDKLNKIKDDLIFIYTNINTENNLLNKFL